MCGIAGIYNRKSKRPVKREEISSMLSVLRHRGPDSTDIFTDNECALGHTRLSIIDLEGGNQPVFNEDRSIAVILNGEIYNYIELREELINRGHQFSTKSDTEVIAHLYEERGADFVSRLNGQFAILIWDAKKKTLTAARDRVGIRPLFYTELPEGDFIFASEIKAIFQTDKVERELDPAGIEEIFTLWANLPPSTPFRNIRELPPATIMTINEQQCSFKKYWSMQFPFENEYSTKDETYYRERVRELIDDSVRLRLRADVPVGAYLSGGLDSSVISTLVKTKYNSGLKTFSLEFSDKEYNEQKYQKIMSDYLGTEHRSVKVSSKDIDDNFRRSLILAEKPLLRTAPVPLLLLSKKVRSENIKVVLTGEGADEIFGGYNIFREDKIRRFWAREPESKSRPLLLSGLYSYISRDKRMFQFWKSFFKQGLTDTKNPIYSHLIRWTNTAKTQKFLGRDISSGFNSERLFEKIRSSLPDDFMSWHPLARAQYIEINTFMSGYLLSSQGDRMMMGNSVEGRFPFLDHRLIEFSCLIPPELKIKILNEKYILKKAYKDMIPDTIINRDKKPYRAPLSCICKDKAEQIISSSGCLNIKPVRNLLAKSQSERKLSATEEMGLISSLSLQTIYNDFISQKPSDL